MTKEEREVMRMALEALEDLGMKHFESTGEVLYKETFTAIKEALMSQSDGAQPAVTESHKQEPVAFVKGCNKGQWEIFPAKAYQIFEREQPLYTSPPPVAPPHKRPSRSDIKPLTDEEIILIVAECASSHQHTDIHFARAIEAKLKEKNT